MAPDQHKMYNSKFKNSGDADTIIYKLFTKCCYLVNTWGWFLSIQTQLRFELVEETLLYYYGSLRIENYSSQAQK